MSDAFFIQDGMTCTGRVTPKPGLYLGCTFKYRPADHALRTERNATSAFERADKEFEILVRQIQSVTVESEGKPQPSFRLAKEHAKLLHADQVAEMLDYVLGFAAPVRDQEKNSESPPASSSPPPETTGAATSA